MLHDDHSGYAATIYEVDDPVCHYNLLDRYLTAMRRHKIRLSPKKLVVFTTTLRHNGRLYSTKGVVPDLSKLSALLDSNLPVTLADVYGRMCAYAYNDEFVPNYA